MSSYSCALEVLIKHFPNIPKNKLEEMFNDVIGLVAPSIKNENLKVLAMMLVKFIKGNFTAYFPNKDKMTTNKLSFEGLYWMLLINPKDKTLFRDLVMEGYPDKEVFSTLIKIPPEKFKAATDRFKKENSMLGLRFVSFFRLLEHAFDFRLGAKIKFSAGTPTPVGIYFNLDSIVFSCPYEKGGYVNVGISLYEFLENLMQYFPDIPLEVLTEILSNQRVLLLGGLFSIQELIEKGISKDLISSINLATNEDKNKVNLSPNLSQISEVTSFEEKWYIDSRYTSKMFTREVKSRIRHVLIHDFTGCSLCDIAQEVEKLNKARKEYKRVTTQIIGNKGILCNYEKGGDILVEEYRFSDNNKATNFLNAL